MTNKNKEFEIAKWMREKVFKEKSLFQEITVYEIIDKFGEKYTYFNSNGNPAISKKVLTEFQKITKDEVIWVRGERYWRLREKYDQTGTRQSDY